MMLSRPIEHYKYISTDGLPSTIWLYDDSLRLHTGLEVYVFDLEGRPIFIYYGNRLFVRGLSGVIVEKKWMSFRPPRRLLRKIKNQQEKAKIISKARERLLEALEKVNGTIRPYIEHALEIDLKEDAKKFNRIYKPISILPPDQYLALVLQPVEGCPYNKCSFCTFYRDRMFRFKSRREFEKHVMEVKDFLGLGIKMRRKIFLSDANALITPIKLLIDYVKIIWKYFNPNRVDGLYSFVDYFYTRKSSNDLKLLNKLGLKRVYIGLESGSDEVLRILNKPGPPEKAIEIVKLFKHSGINVGVIVLIGAGGKEYYMEHVRKTSKILNAMPLSKGDIIYYSKLKISPTSEYFRLSKEYGLSELNEKEMDNQINDITNRLKFNAKNKPVIAIYDIDEFVY